jgi:hypothetical protein
MENNVGKCFKMSVKYNESGKQAAALRDKGGKKMSKRAIWALFIVVALFFSSYIVAQEKTPPAKADFVRVLPPSARMMIGGLSKSIDVKVLAAQIKDTSSTAYGFTTGISEEKGSFKLGVLMADLEATIRAGDREKGSKAMRALADGLSKLGASLPLITSVINMSAAISSGVDLEAINKASLPVIRPFIEDFISKEGKMTYLRLGEWVEATRIAALAGEQGNMEMAANFIKQVNIADYFLMELKEKGLPQGVIDSLKTMAELGKNKEIGQKEVRTTLKAVSTIFEVMG